MSDLWREDFARTAPFAHLAPSAQELAGPAWPSLARLNRLAAAAGLSNSRGLPIRFHPQRQRCGQRQYEMDILATGGVPTRENNWHDLLNALVWLAFPRAKAALNAVQCRHLAAGQSRDPVSDAATLFDESGLILVGQEPALAAWLSARCWRESFVVHREVWSRTRAYVLGHAVLEKLLAPWPGITAKCLFIHAANLPAAGAPAAWLDEAVAEVWSEGRIRRPADLFPLPVLGIPGWWADNAAPAFYENAEVFRPTRN